MRKVIVTAMLSQGNEGIDLEVAADLDVNRLLPLIGSLLADSPAVTALEAYPPGRALQPGETLSEAGVWDGAFLVLK